MELFKSSLKTVLGHSEPSPDLTGAETVERLLDRLRSSTLLEDRRDACRGLRAMSKKFRVEVGAQGMADLVQVLATDSSDPEVVSYALDTLCNVTAQGVLCEEEDELMTGPEVGDQFTEMFIKTPENIELVLATLGEYEFRVRFPSVRLVTNLLQNRPRELQDIIIVSPMGVSKMMDLMNDPREVIRNDALIMLTHLTKGNANIQKIVAFENAFDRLYDVIVEEGAADGGIVVEDCLLLMLSLLKNNPSNQSFFREGSYIQRLTPFFASLMTESEDESTAEVPGWSAQKVSNVLHMLQALRTLVAPGNPKQETASSQRVMHSCGLLALMCELLMASGVPADVLTETINAVSEMCRGSDVNQSHLSAVTAPSTPPRPALVVLLMSMVNEKQPLSLRCAVLYCFQCYLYRNPRGQAELVQTLLPAQVAQSADDITAGQLLCGGLFSSDPPSNWFAAVALSHALVGNTEQRAELLRVQLATSVGNPPVTLLQQTLAILQHQHNQTLSSTGRLATRVGLLMLLATWMTGSPAAVKELLKLSAAVPYLMSQLNSNESDDLDQICQGLCAFVMGLCVMATDDSVPGCSRQQLIQLIERRVGVETYLNKLGHVAKHELYSRSLKHPQLCVRDKQHLVLDHEFCRLFKAQEADVIKAVTMDEENGVVGEDEDGKASQDAHGSGSEMVQRYKQLIRSQDEQLVALRQSDAALREQLNAKSLQVDELSAAVQQLRDQTTLLRAQLGREPQVQVGTVDVTPVPSAGAEVSCQQQQLEAMAREHSQQMATLRATYEHQMDSLSDDNARLTEALHDRSVLAPLADGSPTDVKPISPTNAYTQVMNGSDADCKAADSQSVVSALQHEAQSVEIAELKQRIADLESQLSVEKSVGVPLEARVSALSSENSELSSELDGVRREQEDLLVLLTDQEARLEEYRRQLRHLGVKIEEDD